MGRGDPQKMWQGQPCESGGESGRGRAQPGGGAQRPREEGPSGPSVKKARPKEPKPELTRQRVLGGAALFDNSVPAVYKIQGP